ncbi:sensor domain-containing protein [Catenuloplanes japonicus]|uniref:sensor domain-containing protein n=1 Tax=Catenuloplanes japonicus TaxID=33876 RepID=UPI0005277315|nr:sensor domain-containing protein [Catenuloplanes japonicus]
MRHLSGRPLTVAGGLLLGLLLAAVLLALNVMGVHIDDDPRPHARPTNAAGEPLTGNQPELSSALISTADLAARLTPTPSASAPTPAPHRTEAAAPPPTRAAAVPPERAERCRTLFIAPWELMPSGEAMADSQITINPSGGTPLLRQMLSLFTDDGATAAYETIRDSVTDCQAFETTLEDGSAATISLRELEVTDGGADGAYAVRIVARGKEGTLTGYLAVGRVGPMLSVLRTVGPEGAIDSEDAETTLDLAIDKMALLEGVIPD